MIGPESGRSIADNPRYHIVKHKYTERLAKHYCPEPNTGCWLWTGSVFMYGYGLVRLGSKQYLAHRVVYEHIRGPIIGFMVLCHKCQTKLCVNPDHMFAGTQKDNLSIYNK